MKPADTGIRYDAIASWWQQNVPERYGIAALERALAFTDGKGAALDVGCGSNGRFIRLLRGRGFEVEGVDISAEMVSLARARDPEANFHTGDICTWKLPRDYDFISAWDSTFHLPLDQQEPVLRKLCAGLSRDGILLFTCGGGEAGEIRGEFRGQHFEYSTLGVEAFVRILADCSCYCLHVEHDQHPEKHVFIIARKK